MTTTDKPTFDKPAAVSDVLLAFPGDIDHLLPDYEDIPEEFRCMNINTKWHEFQTKWFYFGLPPGTQFHMKEGIDGKTAVRHLSCIQKSFQPSHEHKVAAVAYLLSLWCNDVTFPNPDDDQAESSS